MNALLQLVTDLGAEVFRISAEAVPLVLVVWVLSRKLGHRLGASWMFALWLLVLVRLSLPMLPPSPTSWQRLYLPEEGWAFPVLARSGQGAAPALADTVPSVPPASPARTGPSLDLARGGNAHLDQEMADAGPAPTSRPASRWLRVAAVVWSLGAGGMLLRFLLGTAWLAVRLRQATRLDSGPLRELADECRREMGVGLPVELRRTTEVSSPGVFGFWRPVLLVPAALENRLSSSQWRDVFRHELAHLRRRDFLWNLWASLVAVLHWFNPFVWLALRELARLRELACDALVLRHRDEEARREYGETLLLLSSATVPAPAPAGFFGIVERHATLRERLRSIMSGPSAWRLRTVAGLVIAGLLVAVALTRGPAGPGDVTELSPVSLQSFTDFPEPAVVAEEIVNPLDPPGTWSLIPRGRQEFFGVPFDVTGLVRLMGTESRRDDWYFRSKVEGIPVDRRAERLYLLHCTYYYADAGVTIARLRLNYADGTSAEVPIQYGTHVLNFWRQRYETPSDVTDPDSRVAWTGELPVIANYGNSLRLCLSSLRHPFPEKKIRTLDLLSSGSSAAEVIAGLTVGGADLPRAWRTSAVTRIPDQQWTGRLRFRALNRDTGGPIAGMMLRVEVAEEGVHSRIAAFQTGPDGWAEVRYPHTNLNYVTLWANHDDYVPRIVQWTRRQHGDYPMEYVYAAEPGIAVGGQLVDETGQPVAGALIRLQGPPPDFSGDAKEFLTMQRLIGFTDAGGRWEMRVVPRDLPEYQLSIEALKVGFPRVSLVAPPRPALTNGSWRATLRGMPVISGRVLREGSSPVSGAMIRLGDRFGMDAGTTRTDAQGSFSLRTTRQTEDRILVLAEAPQLAPELVVHSETEAGEFVLKMTAGTPLRVEVRDDLGKPVPGALVLASLPEVGRAVLGARLTTSARGVALWTNAPPFELQFEVSRSGFESRYFVRQVSADSVSIVLSRMLQVTGTVVDETRKTGIPHFQVWQGRPSGEDGEWDFGPAPVAIGTEGAFAVALRAMDRNVRLQFSAPGYRTSEPYTIAELTSRQSPIPLRAQSDAAR